VALLAATLVAAFLVRKVAGAVVDAASVLRVLAALACAVGVARLLPVARPLLTPAFSLLVGGSYLLALILLRELGGADWRAFHGIVARRRATG
jgi:hypothetical protein